MRVRREPPSSRPADAGFHNRSTKRVVQLVNQGAGLFIAHADYPTGAGDRPYSFDRRNQVCFAGANRTPRTRADDCFPPFMLHRGRSPSGPAPPYAAVLLRARVGRFKPLRRFPHADVRSDGAVAAHMSATATGYKPVAHMHRPVAEFTSKPELYPFGWNVFEECAHILANLGGSRTTFPPSRRSSAASPASWTRRARLFWLHPFATPLRHLWPGLGLIEHVHGEDLDHRWGRMFHPSAPSHTCRNRAAPSPHRRFNPASS